LVPGFRRPFPMDATQDPDERDGLDLHLPPDLSEIVNEEVRRGDYASPDEVVREALQRLAEDRHAREELRAGITLGMDQLRAGRAVDGDIVAARMRARIAGHRKNGL